ncbi:MAG TPA: dihydroorotate dehydrogenase electron transfer subunit [Armatimonadota bacterium]|nr:dihydroorotate dehydrogenase electron transfer subunit [Armatimonadota bacterium]
MTTIPLPRRRSRPMLSRGSVMRQVSEGPGCFRLWIESPEISQVAQPGQFVNVRSETGWTPLLRRPFSFCDIDPEAGAFSLLYQVVGPGTARMSQLQAGDPISIVGPLGNGFSLDAPTRYSILCAGGIGIAPFPAVARALQGRTILRAVIGARAESLCLCQKDLSDLEISLSIATEDGSAGVRGFVTEPLRQALEMNPPGETTVFACGPEPMLAAVAALCREYGCEGQLSVEAVMGCGVGACLSCVFHTPDARYIRSCVEGPVFGTREILF